MSVDESIEEIGEALAIVAIHGTIRGFRTARRPSLGGPHRPGASVELAS
jgi:hypothetical protein